MVDEPAPESGHEVLGWRLPEHHAGLPFGDAGTLKSLWLTVAALATELSAKVETPDRLARRHKTLFTRVIGQDGVNRIGLLERRTGARGCCFSERRTALRTADKDV